MGAKKNNKGIKEKVSIPRNILASDAGASILVDKLFRKKKTKDTGKET